MRNMIYLVLCMATCIGLVISPAHSQLVGYNPDQARSFIEQARSSSQRGDDDEAIRLAIQATQADPRQSSYYGMTAWYCYKAGYPKEGVQFGEKALLVNPDDWAANCIIAANAYHLHDLEKAKAHYKATLSSPKVDSGHIKEAQDGLILLKDREYTISWDIPNTNSEITVPFVYDTPYQKTLSTTVDGGIITYKELGGQKVICIIPKSDMVTYHLKIRVMPHVSKKGDLDDPKITGNSQEYLSPSPRINSNDPFFLNLMSQMPHTDTMSRMYSISWWLSHNLKYKLNFEAPSASDTIRRGFAECREFSEAATAMARYEHIPCRVIWVLGVPDDPTVQKLKGHLIVEYYVTEFGWVPLDPQMPWSNGMMPNRYIRICHADPACLWGPNQGLGPNGDTPVYTEK